MKPENKLSACGVDEIRSVRILVDEAMNTLDTGFGDIELFRLVSAKFAPAVSEHIRDLTEQVARDAFADWSSSFAKYPLTSEELERKVEDATREDVPEKVRGYEAAIDSASLFFAHAVLDMAVSKLLIASAIAAPSRWSRDVASRKVTLGSLDGRTVEEVVAETAYQIAAACERSMSLPEKTHKLIAVCKPSREDIKRYPINLDRLKRIDVIRHDVAHRFKVTVLPEGDSDIAFLCASGFHCFKHFQTAFGSLFS